MLNVAAIRRSSGGPEPVPARTARSPSASRRAAPSMVTSGRLTQRAKVMAIAAAASMAVAASRPRYSHSALVLSLSWLVGRSSTTTPIGLSLWILSFHTGSATITRVLVT